MLMFRPVQKIGFVIPLAIVGTILLAVGSGLYSLLQPGSPTGYWVGFQILAGIGSGLSMQLVCLIPCSRRGPCNKYLHRTP